MGSCRVIGTGAEWCVHLKWSPGSKWCYLTSRPTCVPRFFWGSAGRGLQDAANGFGAHVAVDVAKSQEPNFLLRVQGRGFWRGGISFCLVVLLRFCLVELPDCGKASPKTSARCLMNSLGDGKRQWSGKAVFSSLGASRIFPTVSDHRLLSSGAEGTPSGDIPKASSQRQTTNQSKSAASAARWCGPG